MKHDIHLATFRLTKGQIGSRLNKSVVYNRLDFLGCSVAEFLYFMAELGLWRTQSRRSLIMNLLSKLRRNRFRFLTMSVKLSQFANPL